MGVEHMARDIQMGIVGMKKDEDTDEDGNADDNEDAVTSCLAWPGTFKQPAADSWYNAEYQQYHHLC